MAFTIDLSGLREFPSQTIRFGRLFHEPATASTTSPGGRGVPL